MMSDHDQLKPKYLDEMVEEVGSSTSPSSPSSTIPLPTRLTKGKHRSTHRDATDDSYLPRHLTAPPTHRSLRTILRATVERLELETQRADAATSVLVSVSKERARLLAENLRTSESLRQYKAQLSLAQQEIFRAQRIVDALQAQLADTTAQARKDRETARRVINEYEVREAREVGWREGWREGIEQVREDVEMAREVQEVFRRDAVFDEDENMERMSAYAPSSVKSSVKHREEPSRREPSRPRQTSKSVPKETSIPDVLLHAPPLPIPTVATPVVPHTPTPHLPRARRPSSPVPVAITMPANSPENIRPIPQNNAPAYTRPPSVPVPIPPRTKTPRSAAEHASLPLPPDGYIPTADADSFIALPPPHELSRPVTPATSAPGFPFPSYQDARERDTGKTRERSRPPVRTRDYAYARGAEPPVTATPPAPEEMRGRPGSVTSRVSTRISQYDLVSPPREERTQGAAGRRRDDEGGHSRDSSQPESARIVEEWRAQNPRHGSPVESLGIGLGDGTVARERELEQEWERELKQEWERERERGQTKEDRGRKKQAQQEKSRMPTSPRVNGGPRRPREIVLPAPLSTIVPQGLNHGDVFGTGGPNLHGAFPANNIYGPPTFLPNDSGSHDPSKAHPANNIYPPPPPRATLPLNDGPSTEAPKTPLQWLKDRFQHRSISASSVPQISVEPPSQTPSDASVTTQVDPVLLTPDDANRPLALPDDAAEHTDPALVAAGQSPVVVLSDTQLPLGFVPVTPQGAFSYGSIPAPSPRLRQIYADMPAVPPLPVSASDAIGHSMSPRARDASAVAQLSPISLFKSASVSSEGD